MGAAGGKAAQQPLVDVRQGEIERLDSATERRPQERGDAFMGQVEALEFDGAERGRVEIRKRPQHPLPKTAVACFVSQHEALEARPSLRDQSIDKAERPNDQGKLRDAGVGQSDLMTVVEVEAYRTKPRESGEGPEPRHDGGG